MSVCLSAVHGAVSRLLNPSVASQSAGGPSAVAQYVLALSADILQRGRIVCEVQILHVKFEIMRINKLP
jgi:hypothetical protein